MEIGKITRRCLLPPAAARKALPPAGIPSVMANPNLHRAGRGRNGGFETRRYDGLRACCCNLKLCNITGIEGRGVRPDAPAASSGLAEAAGKADTPRPRCKRGHPLQGGIIAGHPASCSTSTGGANTVPPGGGWRRQPPGGVMSRRRARCWGVAGEFCAAQTLASSGHRRRNIMITKEIAAPPGICVPKPGKGLFRLPRRQKLSPRNSRMNRKKGGPGSCNSRGPNAQNTSAKKSSPGVGNSEAVCAFDPCGSHFLSAGGENTLKNIEKVPNPSVESDGHHRK